MIAVQDGVNISVLVLGSQRERRIQGQSPSRAVTTVLRGHGTRRRLYRARKQKGFFNRPFIDS